MPAMKARPEPSPIASHRYISPIELEDEMNPFADVTAKAQQAAEVALWINLIGGIALLAVLVSVGAWLITEHRESKARQERIARALERIAGHLAGSRKTGTGELAPLFED
ncbi:hypothetical protein [Variovorax sp.]|jgi:hypothetical protein|uniref:hypothetical protein n=1 Tax=Variovorax sp. TaxID=1871043 RepID=UPI00403804BD